MGPYGCGGVNLFEYKAQDLAEPDTFDAEAATVSTLHKRAVKALKFCSISVGLDKCFRDM